MRAEQGFVCRDLVMMVRHLESDPDEYFEGAYNWYFTGGCLDVAEMDGYHFVFHASGDDMRILSECDLQIPPSNRPLYFQFPPPQTLLVTTDLQH